MGARKDTVECCWELTKGWNNSTGRGGSQRIARRQENSKDHIRLGTGGWMLHTVQDSTLGCDGRSGEDLHVGAGGSVADIITNASIQCCLW